MSLARERIFDLWAPTASPWSSWAKPVLFAHLPELELEPDFEAAAAPAVGAPTWAPLADGTTIVVADLPGARSVRVAEALARTGFRPVPLFNAIPGPTQAPDERPSPDSVVDIEPIVAAIHAATQRTGEALRALPRAAPPVFLLDSQRRHGRVPLPGDFDNRSISLPTDFPSASFLASRGVTRVVVLVADDPDYPATDLCHTLLRWQQGGIQICTTLVDDALLGLAPCPIRVNQPRWFRALWHNALSVLGLRRHPLGGFGGLLPQPSSG